MSDGQGDEPDPAEILARDEAWLVDEIRRRSVEHGDAWAEAIAVALGERWVRVPPNTVMAASAALRLAAARYRQTKQRADAGACDEIADRLDRHVARWRPAEPGAIADARRTRDRLRYDSRPASAAPPPADEGERDAPPGIGG